MKIYIIFKDKLLKFLKIFIYKYRIPLTFIKFSILHKVGFKINDYIYLAYFGAQLWKLEQIILKKS